MKSCKLSPMGVNFIDINFPKFFKKMKIEIKSHLFTTVDIPNTNMICFGEIQSKIHFSEKLISFYHY